jgi:hypothetical protein
MNIKDVYIKKLEPVGNHEVWLVDGDLIRKEFDENFATYDEHYHFPFIPKNEFWIEKTTDPSERHFFISHLINEQWQIAQGKSYTEANARAGLLDKRERMKLACLENSVNKKETTEEILSKVHLKVWDAFSDIVTVWHVDGKVVRDYFLIEYTEGGHDKVYSFIPKNEVWIEHELPEKEAKFILLHELHERYLMCGGKDYAHAHMGANEVEDRYRDNPEGIDDRILKEARNNTKIMKSKGLRHFLPSFLQRNR